MSVTLLELKRIQFNEFVQYPFESIYITSLQRITTHFVTTHLFKSTCFSFYSMWNFYTEKESNFHPHPKGHIGWKLTSYTWKKKKGKRTQTTENVQWPWNPQPLQYQFSLIQLTLHWGCQGALTWYSCGSSNLPSVDGKQLGAC